MNKFIDIYFYDTFSFVFKNEIDHSKVFNQRGVWSSIEEYEDHGKDTNNRYLIYTRTLNE